MSNDQANRLPLVVYVLALGTFLMGTTEFVVAGLLPEIAGDLRVSVARAGLMITVFALGMILGALHSGRLWLMLAACATTTGGVLSAYSYIAPLLAGRSGVPASLVPLVLVGFGAGALAGFLVGGRLGDVRPHATTIAAPAVTTALLVAICLLSGFAAPTAALIVLLGFFGLGANPVLISLAVRYAGGAPTLGSALTVSAFNFGTAIGSSIAGVALDSSLGATGPAVVGAAIAALTLIPTTAVALAHRRRSRASGWGVPKPANA